MSFKDLVKSAIKATREKKIIPIVEPVDNNNILENKVALITGGSGGIGKSIASHFLDAGCKVILSGSNENKLKQTVEEFENKYTQNIKTLKFNLSSNEGYKDFISKSVELFGKVDILVNAAGVHTEKAEIWNITPDEFDRVLNINLRSQYFLCLEIAKYWIQNKIHGHILIISSSRGSEPAWSPYGLSKWALNGMTLGLAQKLIDYGIIVNAIAPGSTATPLLGIHDGDSIYTDDNKINRMIVPDEIGTYATLLASDAGDILAGETLHLSAGRGTFDIR